MAAKSRPKKPAVIQAAAFRRNAALALRRARTSRRPVIIAERGRPAAVLLSAAAFERSEHERAVLKSLVRGDREIASGRGYDLADVMADAEALLGQ